MTPDECNQKGKTLALRFMDTMGPEEYEPPVIIHCLAFMLAALLKSIDGEFTIHEEQGLGLLGDESRLDLFREEVLELVKQMREQPSSQAKQGGM